MSSLAGFEVFVATHERRLRQALTAAVGSERGREAAADHIASVYIVDVNGVRQVFLTQHSITASDADLTELQSVLDSIRIEA